MPCAGPVISLFWKCILCLVRLSCIIFSCHFTSDFCHLKRVSVSVCLSVFVADGVLWVNRNYGNVCADLISPHKTRIAINTFCLLQCRLANNRSTPHISGWWETKRSLSLKCAAICDNILGNYWQQICVCRLSSIFSFSYYFFLE